MKKRILTEKDYLLTAFDLVYANLAHVYITKNKTQYVVVQKGFRKQNDIDMCFFNKKVTVRYKFYTLGQAVQCFNSLVKTVTNTFDWFQPDFWYSDWYKKNELDDVYK